ncbi:hypothetical protein L596_016180 [Steinernema carpocapsae]|uniref:Uncharacterized protein n=1 Tax=Steinernema carpocapsae TaxID=34508 RepID=A0A4U5NH77_STECR|nr:hypothetical protein L596_016180 [Steinernema carpocapsae]
MVLRLRSFQGSFFSFSFLPAFLLRVFSAIVQNGRDIGSSSRRSLPSRMKILDRVKTASEALRTVFGASFLIAQIKLQTLNSKSNVRRIRIQIFCRLLAARVAFGVHSISSKDPTRILIVDEASEEGRPASPEVARQREDNV